MSPQLELFLSQRLAEMQEEADIVAISQFQLAPAVLQGQSSAHVSALLAATRALLDQLCTRSMQHLFMILASPRCSLGVLRAGWGTHRGALWGGSGSRRSQNASRGWGEGLGVGRDQWR